MTTWILIAYLSLGCGGGPVSAVFHSHKSCQEAAATLKRDHPVIVDWAMCLEDHHDPQR